MERLCYSLLGVKWKMCWGTHRATSVGLRRPIAERQRETVRKLSPYDVFPPSQRRFRRDTRGAKRAAFVWESWKTAGKEKRERECSPRQEKKKERVKGGECVRHYLYSCVSSAYDIMLTEKNFIGGAECLNEHEDISWSFCIKVTMFTSMVYVNIFTFILIFDLNSSNYHLVFQWQKSV